MKPFLSLAALFGIGSRNMTLFKLRVLDFVQHSIIARQGNTLFTRRYLPPILLLILVLAAKWAALRVAPFPIRAFWRNRRDGKLVPSRISDTS